MIHKPIEVSVYFVPCCASLLSHVWLFATLWAVAYQAPLSMGILQVRILEWVAIASFRESFQPKDQTESPALQADAFTVAATREILFFVLVFIHSFHFIQIGKHIKKPSYSWHFVLCLKMKTTMERKWEIDAIPFCGLSRLYSYTSFPRDKVVLDVFISSLYLFLLLGASTLFLFNF